ncbi:hypothetical protein ANCCEY_07463 [Ancylostoma ceylanicum]|uniref:RING/Ubox-like zinc-binding domain-containing protein n=1 Tax=Ancylostoma ceylanicum TaxID=53326 RepID=A0A0D6LTS1_9BILA|nr:hypothetical protein ANCCEY_07463 [Ancylostoma ceylanicum]
MVCRQCFVECLAIALKEAQFVFRPPFGYTITCPHPGCDRCVTDVHHFRVLGDESYEKYQKIATEKLVAMDDQGCVNLQTVFVVSMILLRQRSKRLQSK